MHRIALLTIFHEQFSLKLRLKFYIYLLQKRVWLSLHVSSLEVKTKACAAKFNTTRKSGPLLFFLDLCERKKLSTGLD
jgi:hypothetical protein